MSSSWSFHYQRTAVALLVAALWVTLTGQVNSQAAYNDMEDDNSCIPEIANGCFQYVSESLRCRLNQTRDSRSRCVDTSITGLCMMFDDALNCTSDIIDTDCSVAEGKAAFDGWLAGLRALQRHLCATNGLNMKQLLELTSCWRIQETISCLENGAGVKHVTDLLKHRLDTDQCSRVLTSVAECGLLASGCTAEQQGRLSEAFVVFLLQSPCRVHVSYSLDQSSAGSGTSYALVVLAVAAILLGGALAFFAYQTSCFRIPLSRGH